MKNILVFLFILFWINGGIGQRIVQDISNDWSFSFTGVDFKNVNLPHSYNTEDPFDDNPGYYRGRAFYQKVLYSKNWDPDQKHFIKFHAINQHAIIALNSKIVGQHKGGYTAFVVDLSNELSFRNDTLSIMVDNSHDEAVAPLMGDFNFYGGIYREVELISVPRTHFEVDYFGANGVFIDPVQINEKKAELETRIFVRNFNSDSHELKLRIFDPAHKRVLETDDFVQQDVDDAFKASFGIKKPKLWSIDSPELYRFKFSIHERSSGIKIDELTVPYGFRYFNFDADKGFYLNGEHTKLIGVNRHQDRPGIANALTADQHIHDLDLIREMGANFLRTAHYPQDRIITEYCDRNGILVSMEIPLDHEISDDPDFAGNCKHMMLEMIHQYYNHPSVIIWAYMNEMGLWKDAKKDSLLMSNVADLARELEALIRQTDPYRYTMIPNHGYFDIYPEFGLTEIPMIVAWNLYYGWYVPDIEGFGRFVDMAHKSVPNKPMIISEYGAGADPRITSFKPQRFDFSLNWSLDFHRKHLAQILERDFIAGSAVWNMYDFGSETRKDAVPHVNNKGLCSFDRQPKAAFYVYQKHLRPELNVTVPFPGPPYILRSSDETGNFPALYEGEIYNPVTFWKNHSILSVNFGTDFYFSHEDLNWVPDTDVPSQILQIEGGGRATVRDHGIGTDRPIVGTDRDPVYQTWIENPEKIVFKLPDGQYRVILHLSNNSKLGAVDFNISYGSGQNLNVNNLRPYTGYQYEFSQWVEEELILNFEKETSDNLTFINGIQIISL